MKILNNENNIVLKEGIPDLSDKELFRIVRRDHSPLFNSFLRVGASLRNPEFEFDNRMHVHVVLDNDVYASNIDFENLKKAMIERAKQDETFLDRYFKKAIDEPKKVIEWVKQKKDFSNLLGTYNKFTKKTLKIMTHLWPPLGPEEWILSEIEKRLAKYINPEKDFIDFKNVLTLLTSSTEFSNLNLRKEAMLKGNDLEKVHERFAWITDHGFNLKYQTFEEFKDELKSIEYPKKELEKMQKELKNLKKGQEDAIKKYNLDKELLKFCEHAQKLPHVRFARIECLIETAYHLREFFDELKKKLSLSNIALAYYWEIRALLEGKNVDIEKIEKRKDGHNFILIDNGFYDYDLETGKKIKQDIEPKLHIEGEIKGQTACMGKAKGTAKVLFSQKEIDRVNKGDILITSMTTPDYVPAMERAAAFVTDEGGLSCHAAIVAREMKKPCVIGTKIATKVLKNGDLVEVDADKGVVRKIK